MLERKRAEVELREQVQLALFQAAIGQALAGAGQLRATLEKCAQLMVDTFGAAFARIWTLNEPEQTLELQASAGLYTHLDGPHGRVPVGKFKIGLIAHERKPHLTNQVVGDPRVSDQEWARREGMVAFAGYPLLLDYRVVGVMAMFARHPFSERHLQAMASVSNNVALAIERKRSEAELVVAKDRAEAADRLKSTFLATMSHELRTPLNSIIGFTGIILQGLAGPLNPEQSKQLEMVRGSARHLLALISDVLDISKIEAGQLEVASEPFDLRGSIGKVIALVTPLAETKGLALRVQLAPELGQAVSDERRFEQILLNLLSNAIKFTERGEVALTAELVADFESPGGTSGQPAVRLRVSDTGMGIRPEDLATLFQPFRQIDSGLSRNHEGTGLGLAICRRLADLMGGEVRAESEWGKGSTFSFTLPLKGPLPS